MPRVASRSERNPGNAACAEEEAMGMSVGAVSSTPRNTAPWPALLLLGLLGACQQAEAPPPDIRPVKTITVERRADEQSVSLTGQIRAQDEVSLAFRTDGRMLERPVNIGDQVKPGQVVARLDPQNQQNALRSAQASLSAAQGQLTQARNTFERQQGLLQKGYTTRAQFDDAQQARQTAEAQVDSAQAQLRNAQDQLGYTELQADAPGTVTAKGAEPGEVVKAGQMIVQVARQGGRDAVFDVPAHLVRMGPRQATITIVLADDPSVKATGRVREVAPQADPVTRTYQVKIGLTDPPAAMRLGSTVVGRASATSGEVIEVPATALTEANGRPAVWVVDPATQTVALRNIDVVRYDPASVTVSQGIEAGDVVVTAGVQALRPGQKVRLLGVTS
ncbi:efflux RND transporter periplasmic adaptor subunit [Microvirga ossetica]|nr:efflux RND transporter periplasmic adaptor subunit [Microvirga ossetica]